jgi:hypothetical protein
MMRTIRKGIKNDFSRTRQDLTFVDLARHLKENIPFWYVDRLAVVQDYITFLENER